MADINLVFDARNVPEVRAELERLAARVAVLSTALNEAAAELECEELELAAKKARAALVPDAAATALLERLRKAEAFKVYVHQRLDAAGVPADPQPEQNAQHGCRIEGRLNYLEAAIHVLDDKRTALLAELEAALPFLDCDHASNEADCRACERTKRVKAVIAKAGGHG